MGQSGLPEIVPDLSSGRLVEPIDPSGGFENIETAPSTIFPGQIRILPKEEALEIAQEVRPGLTIWLDGPQLEDGRTGAGLACQAQQGIWRTRELAKLWN